MNHTFYISNCQRKNSQYLLVKIKNVECCLNETKNRRIRAFDAYSHKVQEYRTEERHRNGATCRLDKFLELEVF